MFGLHINPVLKINPNVAVFYMAVGAGSGISILAGLVKFSLWLDKRNRRNCCNGGDGYNNGHAAGCRNWPGR